MTELDFYLIQYESLVEAIVDVCEPADAKTCLCKAAEIAARCTSDLCADLAENALDQAEEVVRQLELGEQH